MLATHAALVKGFFAELGVNVQGYPMLDNRTAFQENRPHRLWVKTDAGVSEADFGFFDMDGFHHMAAGKVPYYIVEGMHFGCQATMVAADSPVKSPADLKGKTVEMIPYFSEPFLLHGHMWSNFWLKAPGYDSAKDLAMAPMPWEAVPRLSDYIAEGFKTGKFDAVIVGEPLTSILEQKKIARTLVRQNDHTYNKEYCCLFAIKQSIVDTQPEKARRIVQAFRRAKQWVAQNPREAVGASQTAGYLPAGLPVEAVVKATAEMGFGIPLDLEKALERSIQDRIASGAIKTDKTAKELVRLHYRKIE